MKQKTVAPDFIEPAPAVPKLGDNALKSLTSLANQQVSLEDKIAEIEAELKAKKAELRKLSEEDLPTAMQELGMKQLVLLDGTRLSIEKDYKAGISGPRRVLAHEWLREHGHGGMIKVMLEADLTGREDRERKVQEAKKVLEALGVPVSAEERVHPQTLVAWVREQLENGKEVPTDLFGVFKITRSKLSRPEAK